MAANQQKQGKGRPSLTREKTARDRGYYDRQRRRTDNNVQKRIEAHCQAHPRDGVAAEAKQRKLARFISNPNPRRGR